MNLNFAPPVDPQQLAIFVSPVEGGQWYQTLTGTTFQDFLDAGFNACILSDGALYDRSLWRVREYVENRMFSIVGASRMPLWTAERLK